MHIKEGMSRRVVVFGARQGVAKFLELTFSCIHTRILPVN